MDDGLVMAPSTALYYIWVHWPGLRHDKMLWKSQERYFFHSFLSLLVDSLCLASRRWLMWMAAFQRTLLGGEHMAAVWLHDAQIQKHVSHTNCARLLQVPRVCSTDKSKKILQQGWFVSDNIIFFIWSTRHSFLTNHFVSQWSQNLPCWKASGLCWWFTNQTAVLLLRQNYRPRTKRRWKQGEFETRNHVIPVFPWTLLSIGSRTCGTETKSEKRYGTFFLFYIRKVPKLKVTW